MTFNLERLFSDVFAPQSDDVVTVMYDLPHGDIPDSQAWRERREMAETWHQQIARFAKNYGIRVEPVVVYDATGAHNSDLPEYGLRKGKKIRLEDVARDSTIIISMPQFSASAPLIGFTKKYENLRVASLPLVTRAMQETGLSADYKQIAESCAGLAPIFDESEGIEVIFSTGHTCYFDISDHKPAGQDNGRLHPSGGKDAFRLRNLPSGEVFVVPNEAPSSRTAGELPVVYGDEMVVFVAENNQIVDVQGDGPMATKQRQEFRDEKAMGNKHC